MRVIEWTTQFKRDYKREGGNHSVFVNRTTRKSATVPRHREVNELTNFWPKKFNDSWVSGYPNGHGFNENSVYS